ncbi:DUF202 domain-containing protein [Bacillus aquiflavi]|uniref:DUF202 domain-containing protein n=1 Tax=Bacillus aquiflavi TaxID=2672567 RepID=A0A6B3W4J7_9BACI|nr:DUF202 domain-containing protein [Bacillus aquiflavi]MBA4538366.1 DUF202 domain-containing protein [Bacillus aquiflavi]NEY82731.1 DUF202 domain-containing protein [Bacillus aquiflavi]UAC49524.1 DUF202 domain-containing protein [Bacillus aquiflavi]
MEKEKLVQTVDSKYIQQHLANERTYLAWVRTAIAIIGLGFLITNVHFSLKPFFSQTGDMLANIIGIISVIFGVVTILISTYSYFKKLKTINEQTFKASKLFVGILSTLLIVIILIFAVYLFFII